MVGPLPPRSCGPVRRHQSKCRHKGQAPLKLDESLSNPKREVKQVTVFKCCTQSSVGVRVTLVNLQLH